MTTTSSIAATTTTSSTATTTTTSSTTTTSPTPSPTVEFNIYAVAAAGNVNYMGIPPNDNPYGNLDGSQIYYELYSDGTLGYEGQYAQADLSQHPSLFYFDTYAGAQLYGNTICTCVFDDDTQFLDCNCGGYTLNYYDPATNNVYIGTQSGGYTPIQLEGLDPLSP